MIEITTGDLTVLHSGTVRTGNTPEIVFSLDDMKLRFVFKIDPKKERDFIEPEVDSDKNTLTMTLYNYENEIGSGVALPTRIGIYQGRVLYVSFEVRKVTGFTVWALEYSLYLGEKE